MDFIDFKDGQNINILKFSGSLLMVTKVYNSGISIESNFLSDWINWDMDCYSFASMKMCNNFLNLES